MTTTANSLPVLGAALQLPNYDQHRDWILEKQRDVELQSFIGSAVLDSDWSGLVSQARTTLDGHKGRLGIHGPFWGFKLDSHDPEIRAVVKKRLTQGLDVCAALGATQMVVHSPFTTWDFNNLDGNPGSRDELFERVHLTMDDAVRRAESQGCVFVIENVEDKDPMARVELAKSFDSTSVRVSIDTGHAHYAHGSTGAPPVDYYVKAAGDMLAHVHVQDADGYADRHWVPGEGTIRWAAVFRSIAQLSSDPRLVIEIKDQASVQRGAEWLARLGLAV